MHWSMIRPAEWPQQVTKHLLAEEYDHAYELLIDPGFLAARLAGGGAGGVLADFESLLAAFPDFQAEHSHFQSRDALVHDYSTSCRKYLEAAVESLRAEGALPAPSFPPPPVKLLRRRPPLPEDRSPRATRLRATYRAVCENVRLPEGELVGSVAIKALTRGIPVCTRVLHAHDTPVTTVAFSPDGVTAVSGGLDGSFKIWDLVRGSCAQHIRAHSGAIRAICFGSDGKRLITAGDDGNALVWDTTTFLCSFILGHSAPVIEAHELAGGSRILSRTADNHLFYWDTAGHSCRQKFGIRQDQKAIPLFDSVIAIWSPDLAAMDYWNLETAECLGAGSFGENAKISRVELAPFRSVGIAFASEAGGTRPFAFRFPHLTEHKPLPSPLTGPVQLGPDLRLLLEVSDSSLLLHDGNGKAPPLMLRGHQRKITDFCISPNGRSLLTASEDKTVRFWDLTPALDLA